MLLAGILRHPSHFFLGDITSGHVAVAASSCPSARRTRTVFRCHRYRSPAPSTAAGSSLTNPFPARTRRMRRAKSMSSAAAIKYTITACSSGSVHYTDQKGTMTLACRQTCWRCHLAPDWCRCRPLRSVRRPITSPAVHRPTSASRNNRPGNFLTPWMHARSSIDCNSSLIPRVAGTPRHGGATNDRVPRARRSTSCWRHTRAVTGMPSTP